MVDTNTTAPTAPTAPVKSQRDNRRPRDDKRGGGFKDVEKEFQEELLGIDRVTRVTAGGRQLRFRASVVIGNGKGTVGFGMGKAGEVVVAIEKAVRDAKKNLLSFNIIDGTIAHDLNASYKAANIFIHPASKGTGLIAGGSARKVFAVAGIKDILAKQRGGNNPITNARVTMKALASLKKVTKVTPKATPVATSEEETVVAPKATPVKAPTKKAAAPKAKKAE
ncbi:MAG: 30S ribosomal protein S5 [Candidatus Gracilibacteria bacterium]|nr:30S ribosomal protein S5 [Candidatus Gracilibacteria bacterium]